MEETMLEYINAGLIGYGYAGKTLHAPLLNSISGIRLKTIVSRDASKVKADWPEIGHVTTTEQLLADPAIDLVVIATPNDTHYPLAKAALLAGKHVVIDKPFTLDSREARTLIDLAQEHDLQLSVFHNRRWDADFLTLQQLVRSNSLGDILHLESHFDRFRPEVRDRWREQAVPGSGLWYDLGAHLLDQTVQLFGAPETLWLDMAQQRPGAKTDDFFHAVLQYGPRRVILHASTQVADQGPRFTVHGSLGSYRKFGLDVQEEQLKAGLSPLDDRFGCDPRPGLMITPTAQGQRQQSIVNQTGNYLAFYQQMCDAIQRGTPVPVEPDSVVTVMELIELGLRSSREGRRLPVGQHHIDSVVQQAGRHQPSHAAPLAMPLSPRPSAALSTGEPARASSSAPGHTTETTRSFRQPPVATNPVHSQPVTSRPAGSTPPSATPVRPSPLPLASSPNATRAPQPATTPAQQALARSTGSNSETHRQSQANFRTPTPLDRWQLQQEANRTAAALSNSGRTPAPPTPAHPLRDAPPSAVPTSMRPQPPATPGSTPMASHQAAADATSPFQRYAATGPRILPEELDLDPHPAPSLTGPLPEFDAEDLRKEPRFSALPVTRPAQMPAGLFTSDFSTSYNQTQESLPRLRVDDVDDADDEDLPPFTAS
jgi:scyllo-inositol 2-dehydrogenase (NADP+)